MPQNAATLKTQIKDAELTSNVNYLQPTGFRVSIDRSRYPNLEYFVQSVSHPNMTVNPVTLPGRRVTEIPMPGDRVSFGTVEFTILLDEDMKGYREMFDWLNRNVNEGQVSADRRSTQIPTHSDITLSVLSSHNNTINQIKYRDAIPTDLSGLDFSSTGGTEYMTFSVTFKFSEFILQ